MSPIVLSTPLRPDPALLLFGGGGHARVVADAFHLSAPDQRVVASDRDPLRWRGDLLPDVPMCSLSDAQALAETTPVHIAIGSNAGRAREIQAWGIGRLRTVAHPSASLSKHAQVQAGCFLAAQAVVGPQAKMGYGVIVNHGAVVDHDVQVGDCSHVAPNATLGGAVCVGRRVLIGAGAVVLPGLSIADDVVVGAGAVVCASIHEAGVYAGVPARKVA